MDLIIARFKQNTDASLVGLLQDISEVYGYIDEPVLRDLAIKIDVSLSRLYGIVTFYPSFRFKPLGMYVIMVCMGTACAIKGAASILDTLRNELQLAEGETTADRRFTLQKAMCLGCCAMSPVVAVNSKYYGHMNEEKARRLLKELHE